uniref:RNA binding motif protein X-linked 2 n=1 Tax=Equus caballus TaxID=9796 RepID=A0A9L0RIA5_HORSE
MNPLTKVKLINELNEREVQLGVADKVSWHSEYKDSAWIFLVCSPCQISARGSYCLPFTVLRVLPLGFSETSIITPRPPITQLRKLWCRESNGFP